MTKKKDVSLQEIYELVRDLNPPVKRIDTDAGGGIHLLRVEDIACITTDDGRIRFITDQDLSFYNYKKSLKEVMEILKGNRNFMQTHKSWIVNLDYVDRIEGPSTKRKIVLKDVSDVKPGLSATYYSAFMGYFGVKVEEEK